LPHRFELASVAQAASEGRVKDELADDDLADLNFAAARFSDVAA
jgi:hypothetical protein